MPSRVLFAQDLKNLTVEQLKADPSLRDALRELRAAVVGGEGRATGEKPNMPETPAHTMLSSKSREKPTIWHCVPSVTEPVKHVLRPTSSSNHSRVVANKLPAAGTYTVASPGPGWMGPYCAMESNRRPLGPGFV